jgi:rRNA-processing protein FCF1
MDEQLKKYLFQPKKLEDIISTAKIVVDTNVLLAGYQYRDLTFKEIIHTLSKINEQERLLIPSHVLKEFFKRRPEKIVEMIQSVQQHRDKIPSYKTEYPIEKVIPS